MPPSHPAWMPAAKRSGASCPRAGLTGEQPPAITSIRRPGGARPSHLAAAPRPGALRKRPPAGRGRDEGSAIPRGASPAARSGSSPGRRPPPLRVPSAGGGSPSAAPNGRTPTAAPNGHNQRPPPAEGRKPKLGSEGELVSISLIKALKSV